MILIINICKEKLHYFEFVKPVESILAKAKIDFKTVHYEKVTDRELFNKKFKKIIICGTSLKDNDYLANLDKFKWVKLSELEGKPILGICGGMQVISLMFDGILVEDTEIGLTEVFFNKRFLGIEGKTKVYSLHNNSVLVDDRQFEVFASSRQGECIQAIKHKYKEVYGVLFHPEVLNKEMILDFCMRK